MKKATFKPIGIIKSDLKRAKDAVACCEKGLKAKTEIVTHPWSDSIKNLPKIGVFASGSQYRPNTIALRLVKLLKVKDNELTVEGIRWNRPFAGFGY